MIFYEYLGPECFFFATETEAESEIEHLNDIYPPDDYVSLSDLFTEMNLSDLDDVDIEDKEFWGDTSEAAKVAIVRAYFQQ